MLAGIIQELSGIKRNDKQQIEFQVLTGTLNAWFQVMIGLIPNMNKKNVDTSADKNNHVSCYFIPPKKRKSQLEIYTSIIKF